MDAISLLIGERGSPDLIRHGESKSIVEAEFDISNQDIQDDLNPFFASHEAETFIIRRELQQKGSGRAFINDTPANISFLKEISVELLDLHGQHEHQSLLNSALHWYYLDRYAGLEGERVAYTILFDNYQRLKKELEEILRDKETAQRQRDLYEFQLNEISAVNPKFAEDEELESELSILEHSEELRNLSAELYEMLYQAEESIHQRLALAKAMLDRLHKIDAHFQDQVQEFQSAIATIDELSHSLSRYQRQVEFQPERLEELRSRHVAISRLKKKYGPSMTQLIKTYLNLQQQVTSESDIEEKIEKIRKELPALYEKMITLAKNLSEARKKAAKKFEKSIIEELSELGIEHGIFRVDFKEEELTRGGMDKIEFYLSTNKGELPKPLAKVASGGEVSRIMLALKTVLSAGDSIPLMIFDEIDSGISGRIAQQVGKAMKVLSGKHQIIAITHLGQIAAFADTHYVVEKSTKGEFTTSALRKLSKKEHEEEIAKLLSGSIVTDHSLRAARSLVQEANSLVAA